MSRTIATSLLGLLIVAAPLSAQSAARWKWQQGQVLTYRVEQSTTAADVVNNAKVETSNQLLLTKRWQVTAVDPSGVATVQLSLLGLKIETTSPVGEVIRFDSADPEKSTPQLREQMGRFVGKTLAVLRVDSLGRVVEVKESSFGPASRFESELPFVGVLPPTTPRESQTWERSYNITVEPPQGTGEKFPAVQHYVCKGIGDNVLTVKLTTELKSLPAAPGDRVPLLQKQPEGEFIFDMQAGRLHSATLRIDKVLQGHQGEGSTHRFLSTYKEEYVGN
jgi:hypothetical protein